MVDAVLSASRAIVTVEEMVDELVPRPQAIVLPHWVLDAVVHVPNGAHPSYTQDYSERDNDYYVAWDAISRDRQVFLDWMKKNVMAGHAERVSV